MMEYSIVDTKKKITTFVFIDLETTGLPSSTHNPAITELSLVAVNRDDLLENPTSTVPPRVLNKLTLCVNPKTAVTPQAFFITGLFNDALEKFLPFDDDLLSILDAFLCRLPQPICLVAHNGDTFDFALLKSQINATDSALMVSTLCADTLVAFRDIDGAPHSRHCDIGTPKDIDGAPYTRHGDIGTPLKKHTDAKPADPVPEAPCKQTNGRRRFEMQSAELSNEKDDGAATGNRRRHLDAVKRKLYNDNSSGGESPVLPSKQRNTLPGPSEEKTSTFGLNDTLNLHAQVEDKTEQLTPVTNRKSTELTVPKAPKKLISAGYISDRSSVSKARRQLYQEMPSGDTPTLDNGMVSFVKCGRIESMEITPPHIQSSDVCSLSDNVSDENIFQTPNRPKYDLYDATDTVKSRPTIDDGMDISHETLSYYDNENAGSIDRHWSQGLTDEDLVMAAELTGIGQNNEVSNTAGAKPGSSEDGTGEDVTPFEPVSNPQNNVPDDRSSSSFPSTRTIIVPFVSYKLVELYKRLFKRAPANSHSAEDDCMTLLMVARYYSKDFVDWVDNHAKLFSEVKAMY